MSPLTHALITYWRRLPGETPASRRRSLDVVRDRVRAGLEAPAAILPYAIGDVDDDVVRAATRAYVEAGGGTAPDGTRALDDAVDWVRRGLALNRGAVFGALLALDDREARERACERLVSLRLVLSAAEVETVCRTPGARACERVATFLQDWIELLAEGSQVRERGALLAAIEYGSAARAA